MAKSVLKSFFNIDHVLVTAVAVAIMLLLTVITFKAPALDPVAKALKNISVSDIFFSIDNKLQKADTCKNIVIVDMTELTSRADIGDLLSEINEVQPRCIGVDLIFEGEKDDPEGNVVLEQAVESIAKKSVFTDKLTAYSEKTKTFKGVISSYFKPFVPIVEGYANINDNMENSTIRELTLNQNSIVGVQSSFVAAIAKQIGYEISGEKKIIINYYPTVFRVIPFDKIQENRAAIKDNIVLVGTMTEEQDMHLTPLGKMSGVEVQAYSLLTLLEHNSIIYLPMIVSVIIGLIMCYIFELMYTASAAFVESRRPRLRTFLSGSRLMISATSIVYISAISLLSYLVFEWFNVYVDMVVVLAMVAFVGLSRRLYYSAKKAVKQP